MQLSGLKIPYKPVVAIAYSKGIWQINFEISYIWEDV